MNLNLSNRRKVASVLLVLMIIQTLHPLTALALTSGPVQPEFQGFKPIEATNMVDLFTGNFSYNLPLFEIDGYPVNMSYSSNNRPEDEASWVGMGWNLNPGSVNRDMRGLPDDFKGDAIQKEYTIKDDYTVGGSVGVGIEVFGIKNAANVNLGLSYNNKKGYSIGVGVASRALGLLNAKPSLNFDTQNGLDIGLGLSYNTDKIFGFLGGASAKTNINSRSGLKAISLQTTATLKNYGVTGDINFDMGGFHYSPTNQLPIQNKSFGIHLSGGTSFFGISGFGMIDGYLNVQSLQFNRQPQYAFGYLNNKLGSQNITNLLDVNRDNQLTYHENTPNLAIGYGTYDFFSVSGQGVGGQYRLFKNDIGVLQSSYSINSSSSAPLGIELAGGAYFHFGGDLTPTQTDSRTSGWLGGLDGNNTQNTLKFTDNDKNYENVYFRENSEKTVVDDNFNTKIGGTDPIYTRIAQTDADVTAGADFDIQRNKTKIGSTSFTSNAQKTARAKRYSVFNYLTADEASNVGLDKSILSYPDTTLIYDSATCKVPTIISRTEKAKPYHISEVSVLKTDGSRYVFGLPVMNNLQRDVSFSSALSGNSTVTDPYIKYTHNVDNSLNNKNGRDNLFDAQTVPVYAHSYLLTGVLSDDYVDVKGDGITDDDLGNAVKFNYTRINPAFKWRTPVGLDSARQMSGIKIDPLDDKASYVYGEKEIWYMHSIESRNMVAQFYTSARDDGQGVIDQNGGIDPTQKLRKLDSIKIYSKSDLLMRGKSAIPIKVVHLDYDYRLCPNTPNSSNIAFNKGKLTLKSVYFTFGTNGKGRLNAYKFGYKTGNGTAPFAYDNNAIDRWGNYKPVPANYPKNTDFPYSLQDTSLVNKYAGAWNLDTIYLPSGGSIIANFESNDYAYVQNKKAGQMFFIKGFSNNGTVATTVPNLYSGLPFPFGSTINNNYVAVDVSAYSNILKGLSQADANALVAKLFFADVNSLYFKAKVELTTDASTFEPVTGYMNYDRTNIKYDSTKKWLFVPVSSINDNNTNYHPITIAALQMLRLNLPSIAYGPPGRNDNTALNSNSIIDALRGLSGFFSEIQTLTRGYNNDRVSKGWSNLVDTSNQSWIRLSNPIGKKYGGGSRVQSIAVTDNWAAPNGGGSSSYVQSFTYTTNEGGKIISSGIAAYEPQLGGDENSLKEPMPYTDAKVLLAPDNSFYNEKPLGENFYPAPVIGYSEVRVESVYTGVSRTGTGYSISKYYTAKDFPVKTDFTNITDGTVKAKPGFANTFFKINVVEQRGASQGFAIETNDMHGKMKEEATFNQQGSILSATNYYYKVDSIADSGGKLVGQNTLNNSVPVVNPDGSISTRNMGLDIDIWQDMQADLSNSVTNGVELNTVGFPFIFGIPLVIPVPLPVFKSERKGVKTSVTTKHIRRQGILDKVVKTIDGSTLATQNLLYDAETGEVLSTKTQNEFNDPVYNLTYPAHWAYDGMGPAYKNIGNIFKNVNLSASGLDLSAFTSFLSAGDEIELLNSKDGTVLTIGTAKKFFVVNNSGFKAYDNTGLLLTSTTIPTVTVKVIRSGRRNKSSMPIGSLMSLASPINAANTALSIGITTNVLQASAKEYSDSMRLNCTKVPDLTGVTPDYIQDLTNITINPYSSGTLGNWRTKRNFVYYDVRNRTTIPTSTSIRTDGIISNFIPYWSYNATSLKYLGNVTNDYRWVRSDSVQLYDNRGNEIESIDANNIVSAAYYGYNKTQVVAVTANSKHQEQTFESFEDYKFMNDCSNTTPYVNDKNIRFFTTPIAAGWGIVDTVSHTGRYSLAVNTGNSLTINSKVNYDFCSALTALPPPCNNTLVCPDSGHFLLNSNVATWKVPTPDSCFIDCLVSTTLPCTVFSTTQVTTVTYTGYFQNKQVGSCCFPVDPKGTVVNPQSCSQPPAQPRCNTSPKPLAVPCNLSLAAPVLALAAAPAANVARSPIVPQCTDCLPLFSLLPNKRYVLSYWLATDNSLACNAVPSNVTIMLFNGTTPIPVNLVSTSPVIDGWKKVEVSFTTPDATGFVNFTLANNSLIRAFFDDIRVYPFNAKMKSYAYDTRSRRLMAELDENNYATFYEYDDEGILVRIKRETETGIQTVKEARNYLVPNNQ